MNYLELLKRLRGEMPQSQFAALVGVSKSSLSRIESGVMQPGREFIYGLVRAFPAHKAVILDVFFDPEYVNPDAINRISINPTEATA